MWTLSWISVSSPAFCLWAEWELPGTTSASCWYTDFLMVMERKCGFSFFFFWWLLQSEHFVPHLGDLWYLMRMNPRVWHTEENKGFVQIFSPLSCLLSKAAKLSGHCCCEFPVGFVCTETFPAQNWGEQGQPESYTLPGIPECELSSTYSGPLNKDLPAGFFALGRNHRIPEWMRLERFTVWHLLQQGHPRAQHWLWNIPRVGIPHLSGSVPVLPVRSARSPAQGEFPGSVPALSLGHCRAASLSWRNTELE